MTPNSVTPILVGPAGFEPAVESKLARLKVWYPQPDWVTDPYIYSNFKCPVTSSTNSTSAGPIASAVYVGSP